MKFKTTKKDIMNGYCKIICVGYCSLQNLLNYEDPIAYTTRAEGWGADIYQFGSVAIVTGYAPFGNIKPKYDKIKEYDDAAMISSDYRLPWAERKERASDLIKKFIDEVTN